MSGAAPWLSSGSLAVLGTGLALPGPAVATETLLDHMVRCFGFARRHQAAAIGHRMGIGHRHLSRAFDACDEAPLPGRSNPELVAQAVAGALADAGLGIDDIAYLIGHTATPHQPLPSNIALAADQLGYHGPHVEIRQACTGFANALMIAFGLLARPDAGPVVIAGSETGSLFFDPVRAQEDAGQLVNMVQMGDGAGAIVLARASPGHSSLSAAWYGAIGVGRPPGLQMRRGAPEFDHDFAAILASGPALFEAGFQAAAAHGLDPTRADHLIPHQVSGRIGARIAQRFSIREDRVFVHADRLGNTGSAAIWIALAQLRHAGLAPGSRTIALGAEATKYMHGGFAYDQR